MRINIVRSRKVRVLIVLLAIALIAVVWWTVTRPKHFAVVALLPGEFIPFTTPTCDDGFLTERKDEFVFRGWGGRERWRIPPLNPRFPGRNKQQAWERLVFWHPGAWSLSPNGRYFAAAVPDGKVIRWKGWREGKLVTDVPVAVKESVYDNANYNHPKIAIADDGRMLCSIPDLKAWKIIAISDNRVTATGMYAYQYPSEFDPLRRALLLPSAGMAVLCEEKEFVVLNLTMQGSVIHFTRRFAGLDNVYLADENEMLLISMHAWYRLSDGKRFFFPPSGTERIGVPGTDEDWTVTRRESMLPLLTTMDGRFALVQWYSMPSPTRLKLLRFLADRFPGLARTPSFERQSRNRFYLEMYERPDRLRARLPMVDSIPHVPGDTPTQFEIFLPQHQLWVNLEKIAISPDGRLLAIEYLDKPAGGTVLLRW